MKRLFAILLSAALWLPSCTFSPGYTEPESAATVEAIGLDLVDGDVLLTVQLASEDEPLTMRGRSIQSAFFEAAAGEARTPELAHTAVAVIGDGIEGDALDGVFAFCSEPNGAPLSMCVISSPDASRLLACARGFELYEMLTRRGETLDRESRLYKLEAARSEGRELVLPFFRAEGESFELSGVRVYKNGVPTVILGRAESAFCLLMRGGFAFGNELGISSAQVKFDLEADGGTVLCKVKREREVELDALGESMSIFISRTRELYGDIFGLSERLGRRLSADYELKIKFVSEE